MSKDALLRVGVAALLLLAFVVNHALPRLSTPTLRVVPIDRLPRQIGAWQCGADLPIEDRVRTLLPNAAFVSRSYRDGGGRTAELLLETSADAQMFHSPTQCMPAQNWNILHTRSLPLVMPANAPAGKPGGAQEVSATEMDMQSPGQNLLMLYWYTSERQLDKWQALKDKLLSGRAHTRLFVRILVPATSEGDKASRAARDFAQALLPSIMELESM